MSNVETIDNSQWPDRPLTEAQRQNRQSAELIPFGQGTGVTPQTFAAAVDFAKVMSTARNAVPAHLIGNTGACLAIIDIAASFGMKAYMLATRCYVVNGMLAFDGQAIMAIMNQHMPLAKDENGKKTRLKYAFDGEHAQYEPQEIDEIDERTNTKTGKRVWISKLLKPSTRRVTVTGRMENEADILPYESPTVFNIKNKKSPLWVEDEDQQLIYWASRRWQRRWWPEGMLGIYAPDEISEMNIGADNAKLIEASDNPAKALMERVAAAKAQTDDADQITSVREGFTADHAHNETTNGNHENAGKSPSASGPEQVAEAPTADANAPATKKERARKAKVEPEKAILPEVELASAEIVEPEHEIMPRNPPEWLVYCKAWIASTPAAELDKRWAEERKLRNDCGVTQDFRDPVYEALMEKKNA